MAIIQFVLSLIVLTILYRRMIKREVPTPVKGAQRVVPVILGMFSTPLSFAFFMGIGGVLLAIGFNATHLPDLVRSIIAAILQAALPEELAKLLMILLVLAIFRSKIKNVYEYILIGAGVGFGFTLFEEFLYSSGSIVNAIGRLITLAGHMAFNMIMAKHLGLAKYKKANGEAAGGEYAKALLIPFAIHAVYDAFTADNRMMASENDLIMIIGIVLSIASIVALFIIQIKVLQDAKKNAEQYSAMTLQ